MNLEYYKNFLVAAEELNFTQAAKKLYISQQALSRQIEKLENTYQVRLFDRDAPMRLTPEGECVYRNVVEILDQERRMRKELKQMHGEEEQVVTVGISTRRGSVLLPDLVEAFSKQYPEIVIRVREAGLYKIFEALKLRKMDCIFCYSVSEDPLVVSKKLMTERSVVAINKTLFEKKFPPDIQKKLLSSETHHLQDFAGCPMVRMAPDTWYGDLFDRCCREERITPQVVLESSNIFTVLFCCAKGLGVTVCPEVYIQQLAKQDQEKLYCFYWDYPGTENEVAIVYLRNSYLSGAAKKFVEFSREYFAHMACSNSPSPHCSETSCPLQESNSTL